MKLSLILPAYNEEKYLSAALVAAKEALAANASAELETEIIVVDNNSTDRTAAIAKEAGITVVFEPINQISRARNAGGFKAGGDWLLFVDADSLVSAEQIRELLQVIREKNPVGGGAHIRFDHLPCWMKPFLLLWNIFAPLLGYAAGSFLYCRAKAFQEIGGFSLELFASEEIDFSKRLRRWARENNGGKFITLKSPLLTSSRKITNYTFAEFIGMNLKILFNLRKTIKNRELCDFWYKSRR